jgi:5-oxoprolinase (ATP-hydrolysing)
LKIDTIAAGGGSKLTFKNGLFKVGPESVGAVPGPVCYGIGSSLAITDANIVLNRLYTDNFPKVFGKSFN